MTNGTIAPCLIFSLLSHLCSCIIMPKVYCATCKKEFTSLGYYKQHFSYPINRKCKDAFNGHTPEKEQPANSSPANKRTSPDYPSIPEPESPAAAKKPCNDTESPAAAKDSCRDTAVPEKVRALYEQIVAEDSAAREQIAGMRPNDCCVLPLETDNTTTLEEDDAVVQAFDEEEEEEEEARPVYTEAWEQFDEYCVWARQNLCDLTAEDEACIELLNILSTKRVPLGLYEEIFKWHKKNSKATKMVPRASLLKMLCKRYNMEQTKPKRTKTIELPASKARIKMVVHDAAAQIQSLLTDPRITDEDYLFFDNNPFASPPEEVPVVIDDINSGEAYRKSWKKYIKEPDKEILLPIIWYLDEAVAGNFGNLPIEALKFTLGIFNGNTRNKSYAWRNVGYVAHYLAEETAGKDILKQCDNMDAQMYIPSDEIEEEEAEEFDMNNPAGAPGEIIEVPETTAQDLHTMLDCLLQSFKELQETGGIYWHLRYKGATYKARFVPFTLFIKGDTVEHDKMCGSYTSRTQHVKQLCRYCCIPNEETDDPYKNYPRKSQKMVQDLVDAQDMEGLQGISQQYIKNCWYDIRFGAHNDLGVHGATPLEMLHWFELGWHKVIREVFFDQLGPDSKLAMDIDALAKCMGHLYQRQSVSHKKGDLPRTSFNQGIRKGGHLQAHEYTGLMVVLASVLRSSKGRNVLVGKCSGKQRDHFGTNKKVRHWLLLIERILQWQAWMSSEELLRRDVVRSKLKVREIMEMQVLVAKRESGMGQKNIKFHGSTHVADDILELSSPSHVDTDANEMHHKPDKTAAMRTQKRAKEFDFQLAKQLHNNQIIHLAMEEIVKDERVYDYGDREATTQLPTSQEEPPKLSGARVDFWYSEEKNAHDFKVHSKMKDKAGFDLETPLQDYLGSLLLDLLGDVDKLNLNTECTVKGRLYRGSPHHLGKPWHDWVMIKWDEDIILPGHIWCFVDMQHIPLGVYEQGVYAVIESADENIEERQLSELFLSYTKETVPSQNPQDPLRRKFYLVNVKLFVEPACLIPDIGNENRAVFLRLLPRNVWREQFQEWLHTPHARGRQQVLQLPLI